MTYKTLPETRCLQFFFQLGILGRSLSGFYTYLHGLSASSSDSVNRERELLTPRLAGVGYGILCPVHSASVGEVVHFEGNPSNLQFRTVVLQKQQLREFFSAHFVRRDAQ